MMDPQPVTSSAAVLQLVHWHDTGHVRQAYLNSSSFFKLRFFFSFSH